MTALSRVPTWLAQRSPSAASALLTAAAGLIWLQLALVEPELGSIHLASLPADWQVGMPLAALGVAAVVALAARFRFALLTPCFAVLGIPRSLAFWCALLVFATSLSPLLHPYVSRRAPRRVAAPLFFAACGWMGGQVLLLYCVNVAAFGAYIAVLLPLPLLLMLGVWRAGRIRQSLDLTQPFDEAEAPWGARHSPFVAALLGAACFGGCAALALVLFVSGIEFTSGRGL